MKKLIYLLCFLFILLFITTEENKYRIDQCKAVHHIRQVAVFGESKCTSDIKNGCEFIYHKEPVSDLYTVITVDSIVENHLGQPDSLIYDTRGYYRSKVPPLTIDLSNQDNFMYNEVEESLKIFAVSGNIEIELNKNQYNECINQYFYTNISYLMGMFTTNQFKEYQ